MTNKNLKLATGKIIYNSGIPSKKKKDLLEQVLKSNDKEVYTIYKETTKNIFESAILSVCFRHSICEYIEHCNLNKREKEECKNYLLHEASDYQILHILTENQIPKDLTDHKKNSLLESFNKDLKFNFTPVFNKGINNKVFNLLSESTIIQEVDPVSTAVGLYIALPGTFELTGLVFYKMYQIFRRYMTKAGRLCKKQKHEKYCILNYKLQAYQAQLKQLNQGLSLCPKTKQPQKCRTILYKRSGKVKNKIEKTKQAIRTIVAKEKIHEPGIVSKIMGFVKRK